MTQTRTCNSHNLKYLTKSAKSKEEKERKFKLCPTWEISELFWYAIRRPCTVKMNNIVRELHTRTSTCTVYEQNDNALFVNVYE